MSYIIQKEKHDYLIELIKKGDTRNAETLAARIGVSKSTLKRYINNLRALGINILYCKKQKIYYLDSN